MIRRHPSRKRLEAWLAQDGDADLDDHIFNCDRCSNVLDAMAAAETDSAIRDALNETLAAPPDLAVRMEAGVVARLETQEVLGYVADLFGAGWDVARLFLNDEPEGEAP